MKTFERFAFVSAVVAAAFAASPAAASVTYDFTGATYDGNAVSFSYTSPNFISDFQAVALADLNACSLNNGPCNNAQVFAPNSTYGDDIIQFYIGDNANYFYFAPGAFSQFGSYTNVVLQGIQDGRLVVSDSVAAVPEPATWAMMLFGFGAVGYSMRRKRAQVRVTYA